jgi:hypothetical protein
MNGAPSPRHPRQPAPCPPTAAYPQHLEKPGFYGAHHDRKMRNAVFTGHTRSLWPLWGPCGAVVDRRVRMLSKCSFVTSSARVTRPDRVPRPAACRPDPGGGGVKHAVGPGEAGHSAASFGSIRSTGASSSTRPASESIATGPASENAKAPRSREGLLTVVRRQGLEPRTR